MPPVYAIHTESELLSLLCSGDADAMSEIYRVHFKPMYRSAYSLLRDHEAAEDIVQDVFLKLWQNRAGLQISHSLTTYLQSAVRYQVISYLRHGQVQERVFDHLEKRIWGEEPTADNIVYQKQLQEKLSDIVTQLPPKMQEVYRLSREEQLSHKEIAQKLGISVKTVEAQIRNSLQVIRKHLGEIMPLLFLWLGKP